MKPSLWKPIVSKPVSIKNRALGLAASVLLSLNTANALANGAVGEHVNHLQDHLGQYEEEVNWLAGQFGEVVDVYEEKGKDGAHPETMIEDWESVDVHPAIETNFVPIYASIWQGIYGVKTAIEKGETIEQVREQEAKLDEALWQALGAVKLAAYYQQKGLLAKIKTTETEPTTPAEVIDDIDHKLDRAVAKYAEQLTDAATSIVHDAYMQRFEGVEGDLIEQKPELVEALEKDFNVTLPQALNSGASVDDVRTIVNSMKAKLSEAKTLLAQAEQKRQKVF